MDGPPPVEIVVVAPPRLGEAARDEAFSVIQIEPDQLAVVPRVDEALQAAPGASLFRRSSSLVANASIQGASLRAIAPSGAGRALVTLEGAPLNDPFGGWVIWSAVPVESVESVEIVRGAGAGPYGAGALTGVIALREAPAPQTPNAGITAGEDGYARASVFAGAGGFTFAAAGEHYDGAVPVRAGRGAADTEAYFDSAAGSVRWLSPDGDASLRLSAYNEERGAGLVGAESRARGVSFAAAYAMRHASGGWRAQVWGARTDFANSSVSVAPGRTSTAPANNQYETPALGLGGNIAYRVQGDSIEWELGGDVRYADGETRERFGGATLPNGRIAGGSAAIAGIYGELSHESGAWLTTGGLRIDYSAAFDGHRRDYVFATGAPILTQTPEDADEIVPSARFGLRRDFGAIDLRAAAYSSFRPPTLNELHRPFRVGNDSTLANPLLNAERLYGGEVGADGEGWSVTVFYNQLDDAIGNVTLSTGPGGTMRQRQNLGRIEAYGLEADATWALSDSFDLRAGLAATDAEVTDAPSAPQLEGLRPAQAPELTASFGAIWRVTPSATFYADARWESARWEDDLNTRRLSAALNVDARLSLALNRHAALELAAENLLDDEIETGETADGIESFAPPRRLSIGLVLR
jgi:outer membrane receptor protein involved in Fe transport